ncbi:MULTISPECIES: thiazole tautomerase TenI [Bacillaceae]|uniref:Thiazole tautomerase TenI n=1 Tax=Evansella alkalicola TaxID=745819 RepID=A0ABS6JN56_9BACI|nr:MULTISPECIES: thiazole tautomerase TenI [Bacillaceae]MBU9719991.1 thiazole tautomerase TenI [Bacillus alkalicola]
MSEQINTNSQEPPFEIHVISNGKMGLEEFAHKAGQLEPYVTYFHIREKQLPAREIAKGIRKLTDAGVPLSKIIVNDRVDVALLLRTKGIQLGYNSLCVDEVKTMFPHLKIGKSVHSPEEAVAGEREGADFVLYGHIFPTNSKPGLVPRGLEGLKNTVQATDIPVIAIGGIKPEIVSSVLETGAKGIAVMSGVLEASNPIQEIKAYIKEGEKSWK